MIKCPVCKGFKEIGCLMHYATGEDKYGVIKCTTCAGLGLISYEHAERIRQGKAMREDRINRGLSLREEAKRIGVTPQNLSHLENGRVE
jgi:hypothetical protein